MNTKHAKPLAAPPMAKDANAFEILRVCKIMGLDNGVKSHF